MSVRAECRNPRCPKYEEDQAVLAEAAYCHLCGESMSVTETVRASACFTQHVPRDLKESWHRLDSGRSYNK